MSRPEPHDLLSAAVKAEAQARLVEDSRFDRALVYYLHLMTALRQTGAEPSPLRHPCYEALVLEHGKLWTAQVLPRRYQRAPSGQCYENAGLLAVANRDLTYVEGFAHTPYLPTMHAWCVDKAGRVVDPTWDEPESLSYFGVAFATEFVTRRALQISSFGLLANEWLMDNDILMHGLTIAMGRWHEVATGLGKETGAHDRGSG